MTTTPVRNNATDDPATRAFLDLVGLTECGVRFHGTDGIALASNWLEKQLRTIGLTVERQVVSVPGWNPGTVCTLAVTAPSARKLRTWPLLWSGSSTGLERGRVIEQGREGLWGNSMVWRRFVVVDNSDRPVAYILGRDAGLAAPQPLPSGSDYSAPHFAVSRADSDQLSEWVKGGHEVIVEFELDSQNKGQAISDNLVVDIAPDSDSHDGPIVLLCAHYDTFWNTPGAYDNGSGTIALLHLAQQWAANPPKHTVRLVFFTAEEWHLSGSRAYVHQSTQQHLDNIGYVINIDGLGRGKFIESFAAPERFEVSFSHAIRAYIKTTRPGLDVVSRFPPPAGTDDAAFYAAGVPSGFMTFNDLDRLHQPEDVPNQEIAANIAWTVNLVTSLIETLDMPHRAAAPGIL